MARERGCKMGSGFGGCFRYLLCISIAAFFIGRMMPKSFRTDMFPFRSFRWERDGRIYHAIGIKLWQNLVPDMSRILPHLIPQKRLDDNYAEHLPRMIQETCVAEVTHVLLAFFGFHCVMIWPGRGGITLAILYAVGNLPYILIQRYNRPRLIKLWQRLKKRTITEK